jgi:hypothetical protein
VTGIPRCGLGSRYELIGGGTASGMADFGTVVVVVAAVATERWDGRVAAVVG